jgi:hypothetical protein
MSYSHLLTTTTITLLSTEDVLSEIRGTIIMATWVEMCDSEFQRLTGNTFKESGYVSLDSVKQLFLLILRTCGPSSSGPQWTQRGYLRTCSTSFGRSSGRIRISHSFCSSLKCSGSQPVSQQITNKPPRWSRQMPEMVPIITHAFLRIYRKFSFACWKCV